MSKYEVVDILGPPLDYMTMADLIGDSASYGGTVRPTGLLSRFRKPKVVPKEQVRLPAEVYWLYHDVPPGRETNVVLKNGVVTLAEDKPYDESNRHLPEHEWTRELMANHLARVEADPTFAELPRLPGWQRLRSAEVRDFAENTYAAAQPPDQLGRAARRFGELDMIVSYCELTSPGQLRATYFRDGYLPVLGRLIDDFGIRPGRYDLAHWIFGRTSDSDTIGHLAYVPAGGAIRLMPWDLLSAGEQSGRSASS